MPFPFKVDSVLQCADPCAGARATSQLYPMGQGKGQRPPKTQASAGSNGVGGRAPQAALHAACPANSPYIRVMQ